MIKEEGLESYHLFVDDDNNLCGSCALDKYGEIVKIEVTKDTIPFLCQEYQNLKMNLNSIRLQIENLKRREKESQKLFEKLREVIYQTDK